MSNLIDTPNSPSENIFQSLRDLHKQQNEYAIGDEMVIPFSETEEIEKFLNGGRYLNNTNLICILILIVGLFLIYRYT